ncbi:MAG: hypothetical protein RL291_1622 [Pseudomonadota bacterium]
MLGIFAGFIGLLDLVTVWLRGATMPDNVKRLRLMGSALMLAISVGLLGGLLKLN